MSKKTNIALLIMLIAVLLTLWNTALTLYVCDRFAHGVRRVDRVEIIVKEVANMLQTERIMKLPGVK